MYLHLVFLHFSSSFFLLNISWLLDVVWRILCQRFEENCQIWRIVNNHFFQGPSPMEIKFLFSNYFVGNIFNNSWENRIGFINWFFICVFINLTEELSSLRYFEFCLIFFLVILCCFCKDKVPNFLILKR